MKQLFQFYNQESNAPKGKIWFMASVSGISNAILLSIINIAAAQISNQALEVRFFIIYLAALILFIYAQRYALTETTIAVEELIRNVRLRLVNKLRHAELRFIESHNPTELYRPITEESNAISFAATVLVSGSQSIILLVSVSIYLGFLSLLSFLICVVFIIVALFIYKEHHKKIRAKLEESYRKESEVFSAITTTLNGFKEIKINRAKSDGLFQHITRTSDEYKAIKVDANLRLIVDMMFSQISFYTLLLVLVFIVPVFDHTQADIVFKVSATILFIMGPINGLVNSLPLLAKVNVTIEGLYHLEQELDSSMAERRESEESLQAPAMSYMNNLTLDDLYFHYTNSQGQTLFEAGPFNFSARAGEMIFIVGGNGSGKSTLLKLLCGLYYPDRGHIRVDETRIDHLNYPAYRELFSIVFTDFYLFDRLYGLEHIDIQRLNRLLKEMKLDHKTQFIDGRFTNRDLSTGQKKRLAFIIAVLEQKPICIFDELAADQDPEFRKNFYEKILPELKQEGRLVIAVTHDDRYFHCADRVLKMDFGRLVELDPSEFASSRA
ncbi:cyclic peptide export ABC transporter [Ectothiorhodospiraceae bacterium BW-2]|nr:cyclic peptide export ABC transporter [Ectothiorhodospiraceae bacterium BW-2]